MTTLLPRLCLALFACTATLACEEEGPDGDTTEAATEAETGDSAATETTQSTAGVTQGSLAMPPDDSESGGESTGDGDEDPTAGPATTLAPPKLDNPE